MTDDEGSGCPFPEQCAVYEGEYCERCKVICWHCTCMTDDVNTACSVHGLFSDGGNLAGWLDPDYEGYPPDADRSSPIHLVDGSIIMVHNDSITTDVLVAPGRFILAQQWVMLEGGFAVPSEERTDCISFNQAVGDQWITIVHLARYEDSTAIERGAGAYPPAAI
jgi:hypothetical protein